MTNYAIWKKHSHVDLKQRVFKALSENINYSEQNVLGVPASYLDQDVFPMHNNPILNDAPYMSTLIKNPNHIGCHSLSVSENFFKGTQELERELIELCAVDILNAEKHSVDGYVASGGTEANIQAIWIYRNLFEKEFGAKRNEIAILCSEDSHYSVAKAANILSLRLIKIKVNKQDRTLDDSDLNKHLKKAKAEGINNFAVVVNMMTTMFGSVDSVDTYTEALKKLNLRFKIHIDGAYGGFYYPFANTRSDLNFANLEVSSVTLDAHKMAQAPYGTGIFLIRKNHIQYANTKEASYVEGEDYTLVGSRSGANAVAIWMILMTHGPFGWHEKIFVLQKRAMWLCNELDKLKVSFYRHPNSNIITINSSFVPNKLAAKFGLVPDKHNHPNWYKIVLMDHVSIEKLMPLIKGLKN